MAEDIKYMNDPNEVSEWMIKSQEIDTWKEHKYILKSYQCPGDTLMLTACVRDIKTWYPFIQLDVDTSASEIWINNPYLKPLNAEDEDTTVIDMDYEIIHQSNQDIHAHFIHGFVKDFCEKTGFVVKLTQFKPDVHLTEDEKKILVFDDQPEQFVVLVAGGKTDYKTKWWSEKGWKAVVDNCPDITFIQVGKTGETDEASHLHATIKSKNCINKVDQTSIRELLRLIYQSSGTLSVVTTAMHMAAAFDKPAAVVAGGHEPWWWEKYPGHDYFHTIGRLPCCRFGGCWSGECKNLNNAGTQKCMDLMNPIEIAAVIQGWF